MLLDFDAIPSRTFANNNDDVSIFCLYGVFSRLSPGLYVLRLWTPEPEKLSRAAFSAYYY